MSAPNALPPPHLIARDLTVVRGGRTLFSGLGFSLWQHSILLLVGPNGAGKTSLLLALAGALRPEAGRVEYVVAGDSGALAREIHLLLPQPGIKPRLTVAENLAFWRTLNGPTGLAVEAALEHVGLGDLGAIEAGHLSTGQVRRLALARLLVSQRRIWLLDEPTSGLDTAGDALVGAMLREHCDGGGAAVVATHQRLDLGGMGAITLQIKDGTAIYTATAQ